MTPNLRLISVTVPDLKNSEVEFGRQEIFATEKRFGLLSDFDTENRVNDLDELSISYLSDTPVLNEDTEIIDNNLKINVALAKSSPIGIDTIEDYIALKKIMEYK